ncbi:hypothetical protein ALC60_04151 [Trachymyrmex zeteki]|uniref:Uncharacterized protein n=1 Tax=Mycetomoellerius zeteki TaxID=64791 RepID=A0A151X997_9HYME|nr:hypothetical protein ALC60_04151 [Trachymyrmex zeteki]
MGKASSSCIAASLLRRSEADYDLEDSGSRGVLTQAINNSPGGRAIICFVTSVTRLYIRFRNTETTTSPVLEAIRRGVTTPAVDYSTGDVRRGRRCSCNLTAGIFMTTHLTTQLKQSAYATEKSDRNLHDYFRKYTRREVQDVRSISQLDSRASLHGWRFAFSSAFTKYSGAIMTSWYTSRDVRACERDSISPGPLNKVPLSDRPLGRSLTGRARSSPRTLSRTGNLSEIKMEARGWRSRVAALRGCVLDVGKQKDASDEKRHCRDCL